MPATKRARRYKKPSVEEVEDAIYNWVVKKREENRAVTVKEIRTKAKELAAEALNISPSNLGGIDEVPALFDIVYERAVDVKGRENIKIDYTGHEKSNLTVVLRLTAAGEKLKPMLIFKKKLMLKGQFPEQMKKVG
uniref:HTH CENPB-type domain-containing protein n=1 Tax=Haemonchus contortus TaxID=6289 RepID=A0A7I5ED94_HAECO